MTFDIEHWQTRLDQLITAHHVPGASLAVLHKGQIHEIASGVLHKDTGVPVTTDATFQIGSLTKVYTASLVMHLVGTGELDLEAKVTDVIEGFAVGESAKEITIRQLLNHTSGLEADGVFDTGRGDDALERYIEVAAEKTGQALPPGEMFSYSNPAYMILGRIAETVTGLPFDQALKARLFDPLGLTHSMLLPEDVLRFPAAMGHFGEQGQAPVPAPTWAWAPRSAWPAGGVSATAADVVRFTKMHLDGGYAPDGTKIIDTGAVVAMQQTEIEVPDKLLGTHWGLGWGLFDWKGGQAIGHDGSAVFLLGYLRAVPAKGIAVALLTNNAVGGPQVYETLFRELLDELAGVAVPSFEPDIDGPAQDLTPFCGIYKHEGMRYTVEVRDDEPRMLLEFVDSLEGTSPPFDLELASLGDNVWATRRPGEQGWYLPVAFTRRPDGRSYLSYGARATPKIN